MLIPHARNNSMRTKMSSLGLPTSAINNIIDDPTILHPLLSSNAPSAFVNPSTASTILGAYTTGVHTVFILNAALAAVCVFVAAMMIRHKELTRGDEAEMRRRALVEEKVGNDEKGEVPSKEKEGIQVEGNGMKS